MIKKIIIPISKKLKVENFELVKNLATRFGSSLVFIHNRKKALNFVKQDGVILPIETEKPNLIQIYLENLVKTFNDANIDASLIITHGNIEEEILNVCIKEEPDLIITEATAKNKYLTDINKSVSKSLSLDSFTPVLYLPQTHNSTEFKDILFPVRFVSGVFDKLNFLLPVAKSFNAKINFVGLPTGQNYSEYYGILGYISHLTAICEEQAISTKSSTQLTEKTVEAIFEETIKDKSDLIVINGRATAHKIRPKDKAFIGKLLAATTIPVLTVNAIH
jgi:nucleotide-binding universal stress UspA family protein